MEFALGGNTEERYRAKIFTTLAREITTVRSGLKAAHAALLDLSMIHRNVERSFCAMLRNGQCGAPTRERDWPKDEGSPDEESENFQKDLCGEEEREKKGAEQMLEDESMPSNAMAADIPSSLQLIFGRELHFSKGKRYHRHSQRKGYIYIYKLSHLCSD
ncbi:hypothetical protein BDR22DRAFT_546389 [Usnea florida]